MAYSERLAERIRSYFKRRKNVEEKRMFGGLCFKLNGHMCCGIEKDCLMVRIIPDRYNMLLKKPHAREMDFTGKPLKGFLFVSETGYRTASGLASWLDEAVVRQIETAEEKEGNNIQEGYEAKPLVHAEFGHHDHELFTLPNGVRRG